MVILLLILDLLVLVFSHLRLMCDVHIFAGPFFKKKNFRVKLEYIFSDVFQPQFCRVVIIADLVVAAPRTMTASVCIAMHCHAAPALISPSPPEIMNFVNQQITQCIHIGKKTV